MLAREHQLLWHSRHLIKSDYPFMPSSCSPFHSAFIIAAVYQLSGGCVPQARGGRPSCPATRCVRSS